MKIERKEGWEKGFDELFVMLDTSGSYGDESAQILFDQNPDPIKAFIRHELSLALKSERARVVEIVKRSMIDLDDPKNLMTQIAYESMVVEEFPKVLNKVLSDLIAHLETDNQ